MGRLILTHASLEFTLLLGHLVRFLEHVQPPSLQLVMCQLNLGTSSNRLGQALDSLLDSDRPRRNLGRTGLDVEPTGSLQGKLRRPQGFAGSGSIGLFVGGSASRTNDAPAAYRAEGR